MVKTVLCRGSCTPKKAAQTEAVYKDYCKACFKAKFPIKFARLLAERYSNPCRLCGEQKQLLPAGLCAPCTTTRSCSRCKEVNEKKRAPHCKHCAATLLSSGTRSNSGRPTLQPHLATWCSKCFSPEQIASRLCERCAGKQERLDAIGKECVRCEATTDLADKASRRSMCATGGCKAQLRLCVTCLSIQARFPFIC